jgi:DNA mismatch repair ATPase MutS
MEAIGAFEALTALSTYAYEHPDNPFPEIVEEKHPLFEAVGLGHPLLEKHMSVRNDVHLSHDVRLLVVSGSNMSGKSTLLRSVGLHAVLAMAGAPVCAERMRLAPAAIGASICARDSIHMGVSRFYAEVCRLRTIKELGEQSGGVLFLIDELLHGTNSNDRKIGAEAVIKRLLNCGGAGLVTTHDLAVAGIANTLGYGALNCHFEDHVADGRMAFDYRLKPGVVATSNAIELLRLADLI